jgi:hypothetical protein
MRKVTAMDYTMWFRQQLRSTAAGFIWAAEQLPARGAAHAAPARARLLG